MRSNPKYGTMCLALDHLFHYTPNVSHFISATACSLFLSIITTVVITCIKFPCKYVPDVSTPKDQLHLIAFPNLDLLICSAFSLLRTSSDLSLKHAEEWLEMVSLFHSSLNRKFPLSLSTSLLYQFDRGTPFYTPLPSVQNCTQLFYLFLIKAW